MIKEHEGCRLKAYDDLQPNISNPDPIKGTLTIGYGHTGSDVFLGQAITQDEAEYLLRKDLKWAEEAVADLFQRHEWHFHQERFDALVSWVYNTGASNLDNRQLIKHINKLDLAERQVEVFWNKYYISSKGVKLKGLIKRRKTESLMYLNLEQ